MKRINKTLFRFCFISLSISFILCLTSCFNFFSRGNDDEEQTATFTGYINIDSILGSDFIITDNIQRSARPAPITVDGTTYEYHIQAVRTKNEAGETDGSTTATADTTDIYTTHSFELSDLTFGEWKVDVEIKTGSTVILSDTCTTPLTASNPSFKHDFFLKPVTEGSGSIDLTMNVPSSVAKMDVKVLATPEGATLNDENDLPPSSSAFVYNKSSLTPGTYKLRFTFKKSDNTVLFETSQAINVLNGLTTNKWVGGTSTLIKSNGTFELTDTLIEAWRQRRTEYYVGGTGASDTTNFGSELDPLATVKYAVSLINDIDYGGTEVKIHVANNLVEELETTGININTGKKILIDIQNGVTTAPVLKRKTSLSGALITVNNGAELTIDGITIDGDQIPSSANCGVYIYNGGTFTLKSGTITGNFNSYTNGLGAGIYNAGVLNLYGGEISSNEMTESNGVGGGIYSQGTINLKGAVTIKDNGSTNLYLASGKKINIAGTLTQGTNKSDIYVSSETVPSKNTPVVFTNNYGYNDGYNNAIDPDKYFIGDKFVVTFADDSDTTNAGEAVFKTNDATIKHVLSDLVITFKLSKNKFTPGTADEITITPKITIIEKINGTNETVDYTATALADTDSPLTWNVKMYLGSKLVTGCSFNSETRILSIPATITSTETFTLFVSATYRGMSFNDEFVLNQYNPGMVTVPGGTWGPDSEPLTPTSSVFISGRELTIPSLIVCDHEVTQEEYERYCNYSTTQPTEDLGKGQNYPAYYISWYDALIYCNLRSYAEGLSPVYSFPTNTQWSPQYWTGRRESSGKFCGPSTNDDNWNNIKCNWNANGWRLPTEAEWEYLARGGNVDSYAYSGSNDINEVAWYAGNSGVNGGDTNKTTHEVKGKQPNRLGLYDMSGNVWEWCWDWKGTITSSTGNTGVSSGEKRTLGGGSWYSPDSRNIVNHGEEFPYTSNDGIGFRIVRNAE